MYQCCKWGGGRYVKKKNKKRQYILEEGKAKEKEIEREEEKEGWKSGACVLYGYYHRSSGHPFLEPPATSNQ